MTEEEYDEADYEEKLDKIEKVMGDANEAAQKAVPNTGDYDFIQMYPLHLSTLFVERLMRRACFEDEDFGSFQWHFAHSAVPSLFSLSSPDTTPLCKAATPRESLENHRNVQVAGLHFSLTRRLSCSQGWAAGSISSRESTRFSSCMLALSRSAVVFGSQPTMSTAHYPSCFSELVTLVMPSQYKTVKDSSLISKIQARTASIAAANCS